MSVMKLENVSFSYETQKIIDDLSYEFEKGKVYAVTGRSGAGKTTLLSLMSGLTSPSDGKVIFDEKDVADIDKCEFRSRWVGVIFQNYNLLTTLTAMENVMLSMDISGVKKEDNAAYARHLLARMGLTEDEMDRRILKLSGGQQQRVAIARAMSFDPDVILADEPTGNLDMETQEDIMDIFKGLADQGKCIIIVTHSPKVAELSDEVMSIQAPEYKRQ